MQSELKPCPFCGARASVELVAHSGPAHLVCCSRSSGCGSIISYSTSVAEAIAAWNARASDAEITRLRAALRQIQDEGDVHSNVIATATLGGSDAE